MFTCCEYYTINCHAQNFAVFDWKGVFLSNLKGRTRILSLEGAPAIGAGPAPLTPAPETDAPPAPETHDLSAPKTLSQPALATLSQLAPVTHDLTASSSPDAGATFATQLEASDPDVMEYTPPSGTQGPSSAAIRPIKQEFEAASPKKPRKGK